MVPKLVNCSYKTISDNVYRTFEVQLQPSSQCFLVSQVTEGSYNLFEEEGGNNSEVVQGWSRGSSQGKGKAVGVARDVLRSQIAIGAVGEPEVADNLDPAMMEVEGAQSGPGHARELENSNEMHAPDNHPDQSERDRRRKGKGLLIEDVHGPNVASRLLRSTNLSSEDSCDPMNPEVGWVERRAWLMENDKANSFAGPVFAPMQQRDAESSPIQVQEGRRIQEAETREKEESIRRKEFARGAKLVMRDAENEMESSVEEVPIQKEIKKMSEEAVAAAEEWREKKQGAQSKDSSLSVPPGFQRTLKVKTKSSAGASSPFGKFQRGLSSI